MADADGGGIVVERDLMVRDGVTLATDVYRPDGPGAFPVLLERTPFDKSAPSRSERTAAAARPVSRAEVAAYFVSAKYGYWQPGERNGARLAATCIARCTVLKISIFRQMEEKWIASKGK